MSQVRKIVSEIRKRRLLSTTIDSEVITIDPEFAAWLLQFALPNRPVPERRIRALADKVARGDWLLTGQPIILDTEGMLMDGEHRLRAIVAAGTAAEVLIVFGVDRAARVGIDDGAKRTSGDVLQMDYAEKDATQLAAAATKVWAYEQVGVPLAKAKIGRVADRQQIIDVIARHPGLRAAAEIGKSHATALLGPGLASAMLYLAGMCDPDDADAFLRGVRDPSELGATDPGNPMVTLRDKVIFARARHAPLSGLALADGTVRAWNAYHQGRPLRRLAFKASAPFPLIDGCPIVPEIFRHV